MTLHKGDTIVFLGSLTYRFVDLLPAISAWKQALDESIMTERHQKFRDAVQGKADTEEAADLV